MVKVLENKLVDLDLLPGQAAIDAQRQYREQMKTARGEVDLPEGAKVVEGKEGAKVATEQGFQIPKEALPANLSDEQKSQARGFGGVIVDGSGKVVSGLAGTVGGVLKGVGDTAGNTVYGLGKTGTGLVSGLADTAKAPFASAPAATPELPKEVEEQVDEAAEETQPRKPRKIELRNKVEGGEDAADPSKAEESVED